MDKQGSDLIEAMMRPEFYPYPCDRVELSQTLMSWLLFAGQFVYKVKKPVRLPFCDAATIDKRYRLCTDEVLLNGRLAPGVYIGVRGIVRERRRYMLASSWSVPRDALEFAVVMRRLPGERMLRRMVAEGNADAGSMWKIAGTLAAFHATAPIAKSNVWGSAHAVSRLLAGNLASARTIAADSVTIENLDAIGRQARRYLIARRQSLDNRVRDGHVREGHGDLRCDSVFFASDQPVILDCVEYSESLRYCDSGSELASLAVDLDLAGRPQLADELFKAYVVEAHDPGVEELLGLYKCYRAVLRGKLEMLESLQTDLPTEQRITARDNARRAFALAGGYIGNPAPKLVA